MVRTVDFIRLAALAASLVLAAGATDARPPAPAAATVRQAGGIRYATGGIGESGQQAMEQLAEGMNLRLVFARPDGAYVANVDVEIADRNGSKIFAVGAADPLLYVQLPPGSYRVKATAAGQAVERKVDVPAKGHKVENFRWASP